MEPSSVFEWLVLLALGIFVFNSITGFDEVIAKYLNKAPTKKDLELRVAELEHKVRELERQRG